MSNAIMFLNEMTVVDHAYIDDRGMVVGGSYNPSFIVKGEVDEVEQVVVDFSTVKKDIKSLIDHRDTGFDHKLWVSTKYSCLVSCDRYDEDRRVRIVTPHVELDLPVDAVAFFDFESYDDQTIGLWFATYLTEQLGEKYPGILVNCFNSDMPHTVKWRTQDDTVLTDPLPVRYHHGLRNSTSFGCKNIAHGHLSFIQCETKNLEKTQELLHKIHQEWHSCVYIYGDNLVGNTIAYNTPDRGFFSYKFSDSTRVKVFDHETTIENLVASLKAQYLQEFRDAGVVNLYFSEGLSKGAVISIE